MRRTVDAADAVQDPADAPATSSLHRFLTQVATRAFGPADHPADFQARPLDARGVVTLYEDARSDRRLVAKSYGRKLAGSGQEASAASFMQREYDALHALRQLGFAAGPRCVVRPLTASAELGGLLVLEHVPGHDLGQALDCVAEPGGAGALRAQLDHVAAFLAELHRRSRQLAARKGPLVLPPLAKYARQLAGQGVIEPAQATALADGAERRERRGAFMGIDPVLTQGDATPPHYIFGPAGMLTVIDFERLWPGDPAADLGCLVAELKHGLVTRTGDPWAAEPFIRHLYARYLQASGADAAALTDRGRFHQAAYQLRIARNVWLPLDHRRWLAADAAACLASTG